MRILAAFLAILLLAANANAAFKSDTDAITPKEACNPHPAADDILLPFPCGLSLALRPVAVPQGALIQDKAFPMGVVNTEDHDRQIYERQFAGHIAAPFTQADLPRDWQQKLGKKGGNRDSWYFIGKYEISQLQWAAVMDSVASDGTQNPNACPRIQKGADLPASDISWFQAQEFLNRYNAWLIKYHAGTLPAFSGTRNIAFLRLPTEEEWEYAARGGAHVPPEWWADKDIFPFANNRELKDYAVASLQGDIHDPLPIGSRMANPLGIYDTAGNVSEMVDGFFRLSVPDLSGGQVIRRLHGAAGGILTKGGSYQSYSEGVMPGARDELPLYTANGPGRQRNVGLRIVLAALNIPTAQKLSALRKEASNPAFIRNQKADLGNTPLDAVAALISRSDGQLKSDLNKLKERIEEREQAQAAEDQKSLEQAVRALLYQAETLRAFAFRYFAADQQLDKIRALLKKELTPANRAQARAVLDSGENDLKGYVQSLQMGVGYYLNTLENLASRPQAATDRIMAQLAQEYGGHTVFDEHMRQNLNTLRGYLAAARKKGIASIGSRALLKSILPDNHYKSLKM